MLKKKILLLGDTGKVGTAIKEVFGNDYLILGKNSKDFDALEQESVCTQIKEAKPDIIINTVAYNGIDLCENDPHTAFLLNTLFPKNLAKLSNEFNFVLIHFSTDAVFNDKKGDHYIESDIPAPLNIYGLTKYGGDCFIQTIAERYYIFRIPVLFGKTTKNNQFVEKMLQKIKNGEKTIKISHDIVSSPTYNIDIAKEAKNILESKYPYGVYHLANEGKASLYELMCEIVKNLDLDAKVEKASYKDFPLVGKRNTFTPLKSEKINCLRPWREAIKEYCDFLKRNRAGKWDNYEIL